MSQDEVSTAGRAALQAQLKRDLSQFHTCFRENIKKRMDEFKFEIYRIIQDTNTRTGRMGTEKLVGEMEKSMADMERWDIRVKDTLTQLLGNQRALQDKGTDLEGRSMRNNIRKHLHV